MNINLSLVTLNKLFQSNAPLQKIEFYGEHIGTNENSFPQLQNGQFTSGDFIVSNEEGKWVRLFEQLLQSDFADRYIAIYMTYQDCISYGLITEESTTVARFNKEFSQRLTAAVTEEDYLALIRWISKETKGNTKIYQSVDKYREIAKRNTRSLAAFIETNPNPVENFLLSRIQEEINSIHYPIY